MNNKGYIIVGTTKGELLIIEEKKGKILNITQKESTINDIEYEPSTNFIFTCHDNGSIFAYSINDLELK